MAGTTGILKRGLAIGHSGTLGMPFDEFDSGINAVGPDYARVGVHHLFSI